MSDTVSLTLRRRKIALTLPHRNISGGSSAANLSRFMINLGLTETGLNVRAFLLFGLVGDLYDGAPDSTLTLRRRKIALTVGG